MSSNKNFEVRIKGSQLSKGGQTYQCIHVSKNQSQNPIQNLITDKSDEENWSKTRKIN